MRVTNRIITCLVGDPGRGATTIGCLQCQFWLMHHIQSVVMPTPACQKDNTLAITYCYTTCYRSIVYSGQKPSSKYSCMQKKETNTYRAAIVWRKKLCWIGMVGVFQPLGSPESENHPPKKVQCKPKPHRILCEW